MQKIKKAVILAGGLNSRMLPISKVIPKVLLPYKDKLTAQYLVEECHNAGITDILFVVRNKNSLIKKYFEPDPKLNFLLHKHGKKEFIDRLEKIESLCNIEYFHQEEPRGEADAAYKIRNIVGDDDFAIILGDTIYISEIPAIEQLLLVSKKENNKLIMGDSRFIFYQNIYKKFCRRCEDCEDSFDKRIEDMFSNKEVSFFNISGKKLRVGELENYKKLFVE